MWITDAIVLAFAFRFTGFAMRSNWTNIAAQWASESGRTSTLAGDVMASAAIFTLALLQTVQSISIEWTFRFTSISCIPFFTFAQSVELIANTIMFAVTSLRTISAPKSFMAIFGK